MLQDRSDAASNGRSADAKRGTLLTRIQEGLAPPDSRGPKARRCPCCGRAIRAGQRVTTIHGTSVHARCASTQPSSSPGSPRS
jgi:hypothetical protein